MWPRRSRVRVPSITPNLFHPLQTGCTPHRLGDWKNGRRKMHRGGDNAPCTDYQTSGRSAAWLARLSGGQKVESSNLSVPTIPFPQGTWVFARVPFFLPFRGCFSRSKHLNAYIVEDFGGIPPPRNPPFSDLSTPFSKVPGLYPPSFYHCLKTAIYAYSPA